jgi:hypothetical protein
MLMLLLEFRRFLIDLCTPWCIRSHLTCAVHGTGGCCQPWPGISPSWTQKHIIDHVPIVWIRFTPASLLLLVWRGSLGIVLGRIYSDFFSFKMCPGAWNPFWHLDEDGWGGLFWPSQIPIFKSNKPLGPVMSAPNPVCHHLGHTGRVP